MDEDQAVIEAREAEVPALYREASIVPSSYREEDNSIEVVWTTGSRRRAYDWWNGTYYDEELEVSKRSVNMERFDAGTVQVLDGHRTHGGVGAILGIAISAEVRDGEATARLKLSTDPAKAGIVADIRAGIIRSISFGYSVSKYEVTEAKARKDGGAVPLYRATQWTPHEISFVTVPADPNASVRGMGDQPPTDNLPRSLQRCEFVFTRAAVPQLPKEPAMDEEQKRAAELEAQTKRVAEEERARAAEITEAFARHGMENEAAALVRSGATVAEANKVLLDKIALRNAQSGGHVAATRIENGTQDEHSTRMMGMQEAVMARMSGSDAGLTDNGRKYRTLGLIEMGRAVLRGLGHNADEMTRMEVAANMMRVRTGNGLVVRSAGMMTVSDFPSLMSNVANKRLRGAYEENSGSFRQWARRAPNLPDFKSVQVTQFSANPDLLQTNEHGEFKYGSVSDGQTSYNLLTYGRILTMTRQAIVNDDLRAFDRLVSGFGASAARLENRTAYAQITGNPVMQDGVALFNAAHGNLGAAGAIDITTLGQGRAAMRKQKGLQNEELNITPSALIVPTDLEQVAYQFTSSNYVPATPGTVNEFRQGGRTSLVPIVEPILDAVSASQWYLAANNSQVDTVEYAYLDGAEGVVLETETGFEVDGVAIKARLDFAAKAIDWRGLYRRG